MAFSRFVERAYPLEQPREDDLGQDRKRLGSLSLQAAAPFDFNPPGSCGSCGVEKVVRGRKLLVSYGMYR